MTAQTCMYTFNDTKFHWQRRWMCLWQKANKRELDCNELSWWKRWLRWTRANKQRLDHVGVFFIFIKAVSGWNAQQKCQPVLSWLSSQSSTHFLDICRKPFPPILDNVTRQCLSAKHRRFSYEKPKGEKKYINGGCFFLYFYIASMRRIPCTVHERLSGHPKTDLINGLKLNRILIFHPQYKLNLSI